MHLLQLHDVSRENLERIAERRVGAETASPVRLEA